MGCIKSRCPVIYNSGSLWVATSGARATVWRENRNRALWRLYEAHRQEMFGYALLLTRDSGLAGDAVHEALAKVAASNGRVRHMKTYVFRAIRNEALRLNAARDRAEPFNEEEAESLFLLPEESNPHQRTVAREEAELLERALDGIAFEQKQVIVLRVYAGLTFREIAAVLEEPLPTVASRYRRGLEKLGERMRRLGYED